MKINIKPFKNKNLNLKNLINLTSRFLSFCLKSDMGPLGLYLNDWRTFGEYLLRRSFTTMSSSGTGPQVRD